jgi:glycosyltransferase involved in cell wall biosynthesis
MAARFSVVVPTHERPELLGFALDSVAAQTVRDFECIVVDDCSTHPPRIPDDPRFRLIRLPDNRGPGAARNAGLDAALGDVLTFLDDDDLWLPERLALAEEGLVRANVVVCGTRFIGEDPGPRNGRHLEGWVADTILDGLTPSLGATAIVRVVAPRFDETLDNLEDADWWLRVAGVYPVTTVEGTGYLVRRHDGSRDRTALSRRVRDNQTFIESRRVWFDAHPRAEAFRWRRTGLLALAASDRFTARRAFARSLRLHPTAATAWHLARSLATADGGR